MRLDQGPTASFKDFAARLMARLIGRFLHEDGQQLTILTATSGDTGAAVAHAFHNVPGIRVIVLFPISEKMYLRFAERIQKAAADPDGDQRNRADLELILADGNVYAHRGKASLPDRQVDVKTGTITIVSYFPNPGNVLRPGQYAKVRATIETLHSALVIPQRAVQELQGTYQVAVVEAGNKVAVRTVKPGVRVGSQWVITSGLNPGEQVIVEGLQKVRSGIVVSPKPIPSEPMSTVPEAPLPPQSRTGT